VIGKMMHRIIMRYITTIINVVAIFLKGLDFKYSPGWGTRGHLT